MDSKVIISWILGAIALLAMGVLIYIAFCEVFLNRDGGLGKGSFNKGDGHKAGSRSRKNHREKKNYLIWALPLALLIIMLGLEALVLEFNGQDIWGGIVSGKIVIILLAAFITTWVALVNKTKTRIIETILAVLCGMLPIYLLLIAGR